jgi:hypothetical protein
VRIHQVVRDRRGLIAGGSRIRTLGSTEERNRLLTIAQSHGYPAYSLGTASRAAREGLRKTPPRSYIPPPVGGAGSRVVSSARLAVRTTGPLGKIFGDLIERVRFARTLRWSKGDSKAAGALLPRANSSPARFTSSCFQLLIIVG